MWDIPPGHGQHQEESKTWIQHDYTVGYLVFIIEKSFENKSFLSLHRVSMTLFVHTWIELYESAWTIMTKEFLFVTYAHTIHVTEFINHTACGNDTTLQAWSFIGENILFSLWTSTDILFFQNQNPKKNHSQF